MSPHRALGCHVRRTTASSDLGRSVALSNAPLEVDGERLQVNERIGEFAHKGTNGSGPDDGHSFARSSYSRARKVG